MFETIRRGASPEPAHFVSFLLAVTKNCSLTVIRAHADTQQRMLSRTEALSSAGDRFAGREADPAALAAFAEEWTMFLADLNPLRRIVMVRSLRGEPLEKIAVELGLSFRTVQGFFAGAARKWDRSHVGAAE